MKSQLTGAETGIKNAQEILDDLAGRVRSELMEIDEQLSPQLRLG